MIKVLPKSWLGVGALAIVLGLVLVLGTEGWRWLGALSFLGGLVLVAIGPPGTERPIESASRSCPADHSCCAPRELQHAGSARELRHRQACH